MNKPVQENPGRRRLRQAARWLVLVLAVGLAWPRRTNSATAVFLPAVSPFVALCSAVAVRAVSILTPLAGPVLLLLVIFPRWFCRHGCPVGLLQETMERLRPAAPRRWVRWPDLGGWLAVLTLGGACLGYPIFLWLDPLAIFNGFLNAWRAPWATPTLLTGLALPLLLVFNLALPRLWCRRICPLGATQELLAWPRRALRQRARCEEERNATGARELAPRRRWFIAACAGAAGTLVFRTVRGQGQPPLRPPGSLEENRFTGVCLRCGNCAQICPSRIIQPDLGTGGLAGFLTPRLSFEEDYCRHDCHRCNGVCPSGAIARLTLDQKRHRVIGPAEVDLDLCLLAQGRECTACIKHCPYDALAMHSPDGGFTNLPRVDLGKCTGCGACQALCPVRPHRAIRVVARPGWLASHS